MKTQNQIRFHPTICVTHRCNLSCVYCYQNHDSNDMSFETAKTCIDWIFDNVPKGIDEIEISFIGGEPLIKFDLIRKIFEYTKIKSTNYKYFFFATTNGTLLDDEMKKWFTEHKENFILGLSLDGTPATHNYNRSNSFSKIDIDFFKNNWSFQGVKMTLTEFSLEHLAENIKYIHSIGIKNINGVNLFEGDFDWNQERFIKILIPQLQELVEFYVENDDLKLNQLLNKHIEFCENKEKIKRKYCGIGTTAPFFDVDGVKRPCGFCTPMTFDEKSLKEICSTDFSKDENFIDDDCFENCYIYPLCPNCSGNNFLANHSFKKRDKSKCRFQKLIAIYASDLIAKRIIKNPDNYTDSYKIRVLRAAKKIKELYLPEFSQYL